MEPRRLSLEERLSELYAKVPPPPGGLADGRAQMLAAAAQTEIRVLPPEGRRRVLLLRRFRAARAFRPLALSVLVLLVLTMAGGGVVWAASDSLPGDVLYPVKLAVEDFRLALIADPAAQAERSLSFVTERVEEIRGLADRGETIPDEVVTRMAEQVDRIVVEAAAVSPDQAPGLLEQLEEGMCLQQQTLERIQVKGSAGDQEALNLALQITERARQAADLAKGDPGRLQYEYMHQGEAQNATEESPPSESNHPYQNGEIEGEPTDAGAGEGSDAGEGNAGSGCGSSQSETVPYDLAPPRTSIWGNRGARPVQTTPTETVESNGSLERGPSRGFNR